MCVCANCTWVSISCVKFYHQLGQFLCLCLINGLPLAPLRTELQPVCSCSVCTGCTVYTQTIYSSGTHAYPNRCSDASEGRQEDNTTTTTTLHRSNRIGYTQKQKSGKNKEGHLTGPTHFCMYFMEGRGFSEPNGLLACLLWLQKP